MKKIITVSALALLLGLSNNVSAQDLGGGFTGPSDANVVSVEEAKDLRDDASVVIEGKIEKALGDEKYVFSDGKDKVTVEIDNEDWRGVNVNEQDTVEIKGEVDKEFMDTKIDVNSVVKK